MEPVKEEDIESLLRAYSVSVEDEESWIATLVKNHVNRIKGLPYVKHSYRQKENILKQLRFFIFNQERLKNEIDTHYAKKIRACENQDMKVQLFTKYKKELMCIHEKKPKWFDDIPAQLPFFTDIAPSDPMVLMVTRMVFRMKSYISVDFE